MPELIYFQQSYGISLEAIVYKLHELGLINDVRFRTFQFLKNTKPFMKKAVSTSMFNESDTMRFEAMVYKAIAEGLISQERAAVLLKQPLTDVQYNMETI